VTPHIFEFPVSAYVPLAIGFFGLGTGYLIYGPQELLGYPPRDARVDLANGIWGVWMPGFCQFVTGSYILIGLTWFHSFEGAPLYAAGVLTSLYGIHWFALGMIRMRQGDPRPGGFMCIPFVIASVLGMTVFGVTRDWPVALLFFGLVTVYVTEFFASFSLLMPLSQRAMGVCRILTGSWLMYLTFAMVLNLSTGTTLPL
jgi:hypothetical protein